LLFEVLDSQLVARCVGASVGSPSLFIAAALAVSVDIEKKKVLASFLFL